MRAMFHDLLLVSLRDCDPHYRVRPGIEGIPHQDLEQVCRDDVNGEKNPCMSRDNYGAQASGIGTQSFPPSSPP